MSLNQVVCSRCGNVALTDGPTDQPIVCAQCRAQIQSRAANAAYRPTPRVAVATPVADDGDDDQGPAPWQIAFSEALPWAMSVAFHLAVLLVLTFATCFVQANSRVAGPRVVDDAASDDATHPMPIHSLADAAPSEQFLKQGDAQIPDGNPLGKFDGKDIIERGTGGVPGEKGDFTDIKLDVIGGKLVGMSRTPGPGTGEDLRLGTPGGQSVTFIGIKAQSPDAQPAKKIVFMVDRSGSMSPNFDYVRAELKKSIGQLKRTQQFLLLMFNDGQPKEFKLNNQGGFVFATADIKPMVYKWIDAQYCESNIGETLPQDAFKRAFAMNPEALFVLTDGLFDGPDVPAMVAGLNKDKKVVVNTFLFCAEDKDGEQQLRKIAQDNGGVYKYIAESELGKDRER